MIEIREMTDRRAEKLEELTEMWEASVRATHRFLTEEESCASGDMSPRPWRR